MVKHSVSEIEFKDKYLINPIIDKFGLDSDIKKVNEDTFILKTKAIVGEGFYNWLQSMVILLNEIPLNFSIICCTLSNSQILTFTC
ncbi:hypothetical protein NDK43_11110 [Neobacillus pocheonensis]|uniref:Uncharacterized protein n=1 Tax=Neobacillus pocheonensis TaxID=363869 RepID=A0ABT0WB77_9BACI|nr:hypothetical protein [Neobacillus pocheonensis]